MPKGTIPSRPKRQAPRIRGGFYPDERDELRRLPTPKPSGLAPGEPLVFPQLAAPAITPGGPGRGPVPGPNAPAITPQQAAAYAGQASLTFGGQTGAAMPSIPAAQVGIAPLVRLTSGGVLPSAPTAQQWRSNLQRQPSQVVSPYTGRRFGRDVAEAQFPSATRTQLDYLDRLQGVDPGRAAEVARFQAATIGRANTEHQLATNVFFTERALFDRGILPRNAHESVWDVIAQRHGGTTGAQLLEERGYTPLGGGMWYLGSGGTARAGGGGVLGSGAAGGGRLAIPGSGGGQERFGGGGEFGTLINWRI